MKDQSRNRSLQTYKKARDRLVAEARRVDAPCSICGGPIDYTASRTSAAPSADHILELDAGGHLTGPMRVTHVGCNSRRGSLYRHRKGRAEESPWGWGSSRDW